VPLFLFLVLTSALDLHYSGLGVDLKPSSSYGLCLKRLSLNPLDLVPGVEVLMSSSTLGMVEAPVK